MREYGWSYLGTYLTLVRHSSPKTNATDPFLSVCAVFSVRPNNGIWQPVFGIFNVGIGVDVCDCTQGLCGHRKREYAQEADSGRKIPCRTEDSNPCHYYAWLFSRAFLTLPSLPVCYQLIVDWTYCQSVKRQQNLLSTNPQHQTYVVYVDRFYTALFSALKQTKITSRECPNHLGHSQGFGQ